MTTFSPQSSTLNLKGLTKLPPHSSIVVVGAGAFGGWSALSLLEAGFKVTLVDAWGAGNALSSSGDETRVIRSTYGANEFYFDLNVRSLARWKSFEQQCGRKLFFNTGVLWLCYHEKAPVVDESIPFSKKHRMEYEYLDKDELSRRYPLIRNSDLHHAYFDPYGGYLMARESCNAVLNAFVKAGGEYIQASVAPGKIEREKLAGIRLSDSRLLHADAYLFACGSWLPQLFPHQLSHRIIPTKQEVYYFGVPKEHFAEYDSLPVWVDVDGADFYYGIPGKGQRGFKIGVDRRGKVFDPTHGDRNPEPEVLDHARNFIARRFPGLKDAPLIESRACPYESSRDGNFIFEKHPEADNCIFLGGGSGHGFKHGPGLGELVANAISEI